MQCCLGSTHHLTGVTVLYVLSLSYSWLTGSGSLATSWYTAIYPSYLLCLLCLYLLLQNLRICQTFVVVLSVIIDANLVCHFMVSL